MHTSDNINKVYTNIKAFKRDFNELELKILSTLKDGYKTLDEISKIIDNLSLIDSNIEKHLEGWSVYRLAKVDLTK